MPSLTHVPYLLWGPVLGSSFGVLFWGALERVYTNRLLALIIMAESLFALNESDSDSDAFSDVSDEFDDSSEDSDSDASIPADIGVLRHRISLFRFLSNN